MNIQSAIDRLNSLLPLKASQEQLTPACKSIHLCILRTLAIEGRAPTQEELGELVGSDSVDYCLQRLASKDLIVMDSTGENPVGAYPITIEKTPHKITANNHTVYAMCALDAMSVAPMFNLEVKIDSSCQISNSPIKISMRGNEIINLNPGPDITVGIHWQMPSGVAAYSMCKQMIFLKDNETARIWQAGYQEENSLFSLSQAVELGKRFFLPLLS